MPTLTDKKNALRIVQDVEKEISTYLLLHSAINAGVGVAIAGLFYLIGMPSAYLWAFLAFILNFIPYAGPVGGAILSGLVGLVVFDSAGYALLALALSAAVVTIENQFVSPYVLGRRLQLNSVAILLAIAFWGWIWGVSGIVLAMPLLVTLKVFSSHFDSLAAVGEFLSEATILKFRKVRKSWIKVGRRIYSPERFWGTSKVLVIRRSTRLRRTTLCDISYDSGNCSQRTAAGAELPQSILRLR